MIKFEDIIGLNPKKLGYKLLDPKILKDPLSVKMILGLNPEIPVDKFGNSPLHIAISMGYLDSAKELIVYEMMDLDLVDQGGCTALHYAAEKGHLEVCKFLVTQGAEVNVVDIWGDTAWDLASEEIKESLPELRP